jgi:hypothetical protein
LGLTLNQLPAEFSLQSTMRSSWTYSFKQTCGHLAPVRFPFFQRSKPLAAFHAFPAQCAALWLVQSSGTSRSPARQLTSFHRRTEPLPRVPVPVGGCLKFGIFRRSTGGVGDHFDARFAVGDAFGTIRPPSTQAGLTRLIWRSLPLVKMS